jgi:hypothetical protein
MSPGLEHTRDLHEHLLSRIQAYSRRAAALAEEAGPTDLADAFWMMGADLAALVPIVEELQDRDRFPVRRAY